MSGTFLAGDLVTGPVDSLLMGNQLAVDVDAMPVTVGGAAVLSTDIKANNGVIHQIDAVLLP